VTFHGSSSGGWSPYERSFEAARNEKTPTSAAASLAIRKNDAAIFYQPREMFKGNFNVKAIWNFEHLAREGKSVAFARTHTKV
jgi:hypothetical protein